MVSNPSLEQPQYLCKVIKILRRGKLVFRGFPLSTVRSKNRPHQRLLGRRTLSHWHRSLEIAPHRYIWRFSWARHLPQHCHALTADVMGKCEGPRVPKCQSPLRPMQWICLTATVWASTRFSLPSRFNPLGSFFQWRQFTDFLGGKIFYGVVEYFLRRHAKSPVSAPPIEGKSCTKMY